MSEKVFRGFLSQKGSKLSKNRYFHYSDAEINHRDDFKPMVLMQQVSPPELPFLSKSYTYNPRMLYPLITLLRFTKIENVAGDPIFSVFHAI